ATARDIFSAAGALTGSVRFTYDAAGKVLTMSDGAGSSAGDVQTTQYSYDAMGRLVSVTDTEANTTRYTYSKASNLTQIEYPDRNKKLKSYDQMGRVIQETDPLGQIETYFYDPNSNVTKSIDRKGNAHTFTYNAVNLLTASETTDERIAFSYDAAGRRLSMQDGTGTTNYTYEPSTGWLTQVKYPDQRTLQYAYDPQGKRTKMTDPFGVVTNYQYDVQNRITAVGTEPADWDAAYQYKKNGLLSTTQAKNGVQAAFTYEGVNLTRLTQAKSGTAVQSFSYNYDLHANQTSKVENGVTQSFSYDALNRIATSSEYNENYSYDNRGNRLTLESDKPITPVDTSYTYDNRNRLNAVQLDGSSHVNYKYNGDNLLTERIENGITTRYYYDGDQMIAEGTVTNGVAAHKASYLRGSQLVARVDATGSKAYYVHNGHGDVVELRDANGNVINQYAYDLWGNPTTVLQGVDNPFLYSGEYWDESVKLQYLRARWYDPSMGRFINEDTYEGDITNPLSLNLYTYVHNNPLTYIDPTGHWCESANGKWAHPGACNDSTSTYSDDMYHDGDHYRYDGVEPPPAVYYYPIEDRFVRWVAGDNEAYSIASVSTQKEMRTQLFKNATSELGLDYFVNGFLFGASLASGTAELNLLRAGGLALRSGSLSSAAARAWYLEQELLIASRIDSTLKLEQQAFQAFKFRNQIRSQARNLMSDRTLAESLAKTDPNLSWEQVVQKQIKKGYTGDDIWRAIIESSQRSRKSVNDKFGL
ncbi:RHS repeat-associated core domain-containing protein, partial [Paenibacillus lutrae]